MDINKIQAMLNDNSHDLDDIDDNALEDELNAILSGGPLPKSTARRTAPKPPEKAKPSRRKPTEPTTNTKAARSSKPLNDPMLDISQIERMLNSFDVHYKSDDEHDTDTDVDDNLLSELDDIVNSSRAFTAATPSMTEESSPKRLPPAMLPERVNNTPQEAKIPRIDKKPDIVVPSTFASHSVISTSHINSSPVIDQKSQQLAQVKQLQIEYKRAALKAKNNGDKDAALNHLKISKHLDSMINSLNANEDIDISQLPPKPDDSLSFSQTPVSAPSTSSGSTVPAGNIELPEVTQEEANKIFNAPKSAGTVLEALQQRLEKFKSTQEQANAEQNSAKARRLGRIVKQYEAAIKNHKGGKPVDYEELPCPPGFPPIPVPGSKPEQSNVSDAPPSKPSAVVAPQQIVKPQQPGVPPPKSINKPAASNQPAPSSQQAQGTTPKPPLKRGMSTTGSKQLKFLLERQRLFREAALEAKKRGEIEQAKEYLRQAKGFDPLIEATKSGLPIDATSIPTPPQNKDEFVIIDEHESIAEPSSSKRNSVFYTEETREELFRKIERELKDQIEMCNRNKEYFAKMGDIPSSSKFEKYAIESRKDLNMLLVRWQNGDNIPTYRTEMRTFSIVVSNHDVGINELYVDIISARDLPGKPEIDTYVRADFPFPSEKPQWKRTKTFYNSIHPEYNDTLKFEIDRKSRSLARVLKRYPLKIEVFSKGGFLRSDTSLGAVQFKLGDLEQKCTLHESLQLMEGRKASHARLEFKVRLREPLLAKQIEEIKEKWIVFG